MLTFPSPDSLCHQLEPPHANGDIHGTEKGRKWMGIKGKKMEEKSSHKECIRRKSNRVNRHLQVTDFITFSACR
jgi:hypothetical protein